MVENRLLEFSFFQQATFDPTMPLTTANNASWTPTVDNGITNNGYEVMKDEETNGEK
jgi:hypothetical protein